MSTEATHLLDDRLTLHHGDCLEVLRLLPDASIDAVVTDPPYGLDFMGKEWDSPARMTGQLATGDEIRGAFAYGGTHDRGHAAHDPARFGAWCELWARECLRVLKPGGHMLAFGGSRTWHRLAVAVEDAGFEIRDSIAWLYGSGFPKSLDVSKAIDKRRDDTADVRRVCRWLRGHIDEHQTITVRGLAERFGFHPRMVEHWAARDTDSQPSLPTLEQWDALREALGFSDELDAEVLRLNLRKGEPGEAWADRPVTGQVTEWENRVNYALTSRDGLRRDEPTSDDARAWKGWGTALKPAFEPIVVGRKPLAGTVAANVLTHGTGALNIDACRTATSEADKATINAKHAGMNAETYSRPPGTSLNLSVNPMALKPAEAHEGGRWPANVVMDESQADELDAQSDDEGYGAGGGASRFFYVSKADTSERVRVDGVAHPTVKPLSLMR